MCAGDLKPHAKKRVQTSRLAADLHRSTAGRQAPEVAKPHAVILALRKPERDLLPEVEPERSVATAALVTRLEDRAEGSL